MVWTQWACGLNREGGLITIGQSDLSWVYLAKASSIFNVISDLNE